MHFDAITRVPGDPILGLMDLYAQDSNPNKFDLGVGVYKDDQGLTPIPRSVKLAEQRLVDTQTTKTYIGGHGNAAFGALAAYDDLVPAFEVLFRQQDGNWQAFYAAVRQLAELPREQRTQQLLQLAAEKPAVPKD